MQIPKIELGPIWPPLPESDESTQNASEPVQGHAEIPQAGRSDSAKFTPGPWEVVDRRQAPLKNIAIVRQGVKIGEVSSVHQRDYLAGFKDDRDSQAADAIDAIGLANANLFAAAPDMYEALKHCSAFLINYTDFEKQGFAKHAYELARAALTKAGGPL